MSESNAHPEPRDGDLLDDRWVIEEVLPGSMGSVFILSDPATGVLLAAKTPLLGTALDAAALRRFAVESRNWLALGADPHVVEASFLEDIAVDGELRPFLFLEFVDGPTLGQVLEREGALAVPVALDIGSGIAWGMAHAHGEERAGARLVHRDLKPDNVFLTRDRVVKVSDFGIAQALDRAEELVSEGAGVGTPYYAAPEQLRDARAAGPQSDVYAFGALMHHLLTGAPPFPADNLAQLVLKVLRDAPPPPSSLRAGIPASLDRLVLACLAKSPGDRPDSFSDVLRELSEIREDDRLWQPGESDRSCPVCGWMSASGQKTCSVCRAEMGPGVRYAPVSRRSSQATPTLGRSGSGSLAVEGVEVRPRVAREGEHLVITALIGNSGSDAVGGVFVPYVLPDLDAFDRPEGHRRGFRGNVPPTAEGAPLRVSWTVRPLTAGSYLLDAVRATFRRSTGERVSVRGPVATIEVQPRDTLPLVGRDAEIAELSACMESASHGACTLVSGRRGLGKSRLVRELREIATQRGFLVARGRCLGRGVEVRGALKEALRGLLALPRDRTGPAETAAALVALLGDAARSSPNLLEFLAAELLARPLPRGESPGVMWSRFAEAIARSRPFLLVLEDVQRDPDVGNVAAQMTLHAGHAGVPFATLMTARPGLADGAAGRDLLDRMARMSDQIGCARVLELGPIDAESVERLVDEVLTPNDFAATAPWLLPRIAELSGGNPLFVAELVRALRATPSSGQSLLVTRDGRWTPSEALSPAALDGVVPPKLEELVMSRLARLPEELAAVARAAGVLGDVFETALLHHVMGGAESVGPVLARMETEGLLRESNDRQARVRFREPLLPEILARLSRTGHPEEWERVNGLAADWLLAHEEPDGRLALRLARHLAAAGRPAEAFRGRLAAARRLADRQSFRRASEVLRDAESLVEASGLEPSAQELTELRVLRADAQRFSGDYTAALSTYEALIAAPGDRAPSGRELATVYSRMGRVHEALGRLQDALRCYATGLSLRVAHGLDGDAAMSLVNLAGLHLLRGETARGEAYLERANRAARDADNPRALGRGHALLGRVLVARGELRAARAAVREALRWARVARDRTTSADAWNVLGMADSAEGRAARSLAHFQRALRLRQEIGDLAAVAASWNNVAAVHEILGDRAEALRGFERAVDLYRRIESARGLGVALTNVGRMHLDDGRPRRAERCLTEACAVLAPSGDPVTWAVALAELGRLRTATSPPGSAGHNEARATLARAHELVVHRGEHDSEAAVVEALAAWHISVGDDVTAVTLAREASQLDGVDPRRRVGLLATVARLGGDAAAATEALRLAQAGSGPRVRARALSAMARVRHKEGDERAAAQYLRRAAGLLRQVGVEDPLLHSVLRRTAEALRASDPAAADASAARADELAQTLRKRGYVGF